MYGKLVPTVMLLRDGTFEGVIKSGRLSSDPVKVLEETCLGFFLLPFFLHMKTQNSLPWKTWSFNTILEVEARPFPATQICQYFHLGTRQNPEP